MDRYALDGPYKAHFACFRCRKAFKQAPEADLPADRRPAPGERRVAPCPQCGAPMAEMGPDFEAPKQSDARQWEVVELLHRRGIRFAGGAGPRPSELKDLEAYLSTRFTDTEGERLLRKIRQRMDGARP